MDIWFNIGKKLRTFYEWYFRDSIQISSPTLNQRSKQLGKILTLIGLVGWLGFFLFVWVTKWSGRGPNLDQWFTFILISIIVPWVSYRVFRMLFWLVDRFEATSIDVLSDTSRKLIPIFVVLILIPVTLHLWGHMILSSFDQDMNLWDFFESWQLFSIGTSVP